MAALSKEQIINLALKSAQTTPLASSRQGEFDDVYELKKGAMLKERHWPFTLALTENLMSTQTGDDLNYSYKYQMPPGTIAVMDIAQSRDDLVRPNRINTLSSYSQLQLGYSPSTPEDRTGISLQAGADAKDFIFVKGILHTKTQATIAVIQKQVSESDFSEDFTLALTYNLAGHFARAVKGNPALAYDLERQARMYHMRAARPLIQEPRDVQDILFRRWLLTFYKERFR